jgi:hypothetical protein
MQQIPVENIDNIPQKQPQVLISKKPNTLPVVILSVLATLAVLLLAFLLYKTFLVNNSSRAVPITTTGQNANNEGKTNWLTYTNSEYKFKLKYPSNYRVEDALFEYRPFYPFDEKNVLNIEITRDVYKYKAQNPLIRLAIFDTGKLVSEIISDLKTSNTKNIEDLDDPQNPFYGDNVSLPEIFSQKNVTVAGITAVEIDRFAGPGAPNDDYLEYYFKRDGYIYLLKVNGERNGDDPLENASIEAADLKKIIETFEFFNN